MAAATGIELDSDIGFPAEMYCSVSIIAENKLVVMVGDSTAGVEPGLTGVFDFTHAA